MIWWTGLAPWEFEFPFPGSLTSTFPAGSRCAAKPSLSPRLSVPDCSLVTALERIEGLFDSLRLKFDPSIHPKSVTMLQVSDVSRGRPCPRVARSRQRLSRFVSSGVGHGCGGRSSGVGGGCGGGGAARHDGAMPGLLHPSTSEYTLDARLPPTLTIIPNRPNPSCVERSAGWLWRRRRGAP